MRKEYINAGVAILAWFVVVWLLSWTVGLTEKGMFALSFWSLLGLGIVFSGLGVSLKEKSA